MVELLSRAEKACAFARRSRSDKKIERDDESHLALKRLSVAARDVDGRIAATPGHRHHLRGAARHIGPVRRQCQRIAMRPVPRHVIGISVVEIA